MKKTCLFLVQALVAFSLILAVGCSKEDDGGGSTSSGSLKVGQKYQGGIIAYIDDSGKHGLIAAPEDQSSGVKWYNGEDFLVTTVTEIGTGKDNTKRIVQMQGDGVYAAKICDDLVLNGYEDWFLPSRDELDILYQNRLEIGGFNYSGVYWSSSEGSNYNAWYQYFYSGDQNYYGKGGTYRVRAVRAF